MAESHREEIAKLEALYASNPGGRVFVHLAEAYRRTGEHERARHILEEGLSRHTDSVSGFVVLGRVLTDLDEMTDAEAAFRRVIELDEGNLIALRSLGDMARAAGRLAEAADFYGDALSRNPSDGEVRSLLDAVQRDRAAADVASGDMPGLTDWEPVRPDLEWAAEPVQPSPDDQPDGGPLDPEWRGSPEWASLESGSGESVAPPSAAPGQVDEPGDTMADVEFGFVELDGLPGDLASLADEEQDVVGDDVAAELVRELESVDRDEHVVEDADIVTALDDFADRMPTDLDPDDQTVAPLHITPLAAEPTPDLDAAVTDTDPANDREAALDEFEVADAELEVAGAEFEVAEAEFEVAAAEFEVAEAEFEVAEHEFESAAAEAEVAEDEFGAARAEFEVAEAEFGAGAGFEVAEDEAGAAAAEFEVAEDEFGAAAAQFEVAEDEFGAAAAQFEVAEDEFGAAEAEFEVAEDEFGAAAAEFEVAEEGFESAAAEFGAVEGEEAAADDFEVADHEFEVADDEIEVADDEIEVAAAPFEATAGDAEPGGGSYDEVEADGPVYDEYTAAGFGRAVTDEAPLDVAAEPPTFGDDVGLNTETIAELYRSQGFHERAADIYRALLQQRPDDERLAERLREVERSLAPPARAAAMPSDSADAPSGVEADDEVRDEEASVSWLHGAGAVWVRQEASADDATPYTWTNRGDDDSTSPPIRRYLQELIGWHSAMESPSADPAEASAPPADFPWDDAAVDAGESDAGDDPAGGAAQVGGVADEEPAAFAPADELPGSAPGRVDETHESREPVARTGDPVEDAFLDWYGGDTDSAGDDEVLEDAPASQDDYEEEVEDEDLEMFRTWLKSLKK